MSHMPSVDQPFGVGYNVKNYGAVGDGTTNDTTAIQRTITAAGTDGVVLFPPGVYRCANLTIDGKTRLTLFGQSGATLKTLDSPTNPLIRLGDSSSSTDVTITGLTFDGNSFAGTGNGMGLRVKQQTRFRVIDCRFQNFWTHAISFPSGSSATSFVTISRCSFQNIGIGYTADHTFNANSPSGCGVSITSTTAPTNVRIDGCTFDTIKGAAAIYVQAVTTMAIANCTISNTGYRGIKFAGTSRSRNATVRGCTIVDIGSVYESSSTPGSSLYGQGSNGVFVFSASGHVASDVVVQDCYIANTGENGIEGACVAQGNTIANTGYAYSGFGSGLALSGIYPGNGSVVRDNTIVNAGSHGVHYFLSGSAMTDVDISDNYIESPVLRGVFLQSDGAAGSMRRCSVRNNKISAVTGSPVYGVRVQASAGASVDNSNVVLGNIIEGTFSSGAVNVDGTAIHASEFDSTGSRTTIRTKAGAPVDGDFSINPADGTLVVDTTNSKLYVRVGGTWKMVAVA